MKRKVLVNYIVSQPRENLKKVFGFWLDTDERDLLSDEYNDNEVEQIALMLAEFNNSNRKVLV